MLDLLKAWSVTGGGIVLILLDLMFIPGGVLLAVGAGAMLWAVWMAQDAAGPWAALAHLVVSLAISPWIVRLGLSRSALKRELRAEEGFVAVSDKTRYIGSVGRAHSPLRPSGSVSIEHEGREQIIDCVAEGGAFIEAGAPVCVLRSEGPSLVVRRLPATPISSSQAQASQNS